MYAMQNKHTPFGHSVTPPFASKPVRYKRPTAHTISNTLNSIGMSALNVRYGSKSWVWEGSVRCQKAFPHAFCIAPAFCTDVHSAQMAIYADASSPGGPPAGGAGAGSENR